MTTLHEVTNALASFKDELAKQWIQDDVIKMRIATYYEAWMSDVWDHKCPLTLIEYIEVCLDDPRVIGIY